MADMIAVTGHHVGKCCPFCDHELHAGDPPVCLNADCFLFGWPAPLPVQRMIRDVVRKAPGSPLREHRIRVAEAKSRLEHREYGNGESPAS